MIRILIFLDIFCRSNGSFKREREILMLMLGIRNDYFLNVKTKIEN